ncbi:MAG: hypothetical protein KF900_09145 [Bacteroidetes bacterium]|nr:hypothetical protein [Bacteroidota bacterium]
MTVTILRTPESAGGAKQYYISKTDKELNDSIEEAIDLTVEYLLPKYLESNSALEIHNNKLQKENEQLKIELEKLKG